MIQSFLQLALPKNSKAKFAEQKQMKPMPQLVAKMAENTHIFFGLSFLALTISYLAALAAIGAGNTTADLTLLFTFETFRPWLVFRDAFLLDEYPVTGWRHGVAPFFLPDYALLWPLFAVGVDFRVATYMLPLLFALLSAGGWIMVCDTLFGKSWLRRTVVVVLHALPFLFTAVSLDDFFQLSFQPMSHQGTWAFLPWMLLFFLKALDAQSKAQERHCLAVYAALLAFQAASNLVIVSWLVAPALFAMAVAYWPMRTGKKKDSESRKETFLRLGVFTAWSASGVAAGALMLKVLPFTPNRNTDSFLSINPENMLKAASGLADSIGELALRDFMSSAILIAFFALALRNLFSLTLGKFAASHQLKAPETAQQENKHLFMAVFVFAAMGSSVAAQIATGNFHPVSFSEIATVNLRYILPVLYFPLFVGWALLPSSLLPTQTKKLASSAAVAVVTAASCLAAARSWPGLGQLDYFGTPFQKCFAENARRLGWQAGVATSPFSGLNAHPDTDVTRILPVSVTRRPSSLYLYLDWLPYNRHWFNGDFQFVVVNGFQGRVFGRKPALDKDISCSYAEAADCLLVSESHLFLDEAAAIATLGKPNEVVNCAGIGLFHYDPPLRMDFTRFSNLDKILFTYNSG